MTPPDHNTLCLVIAYATIAGCALSAACGLGLLLAKLFKRKR
jgi:hypothetical protein